MHELRSSNSPLSRVQHQARKCVVDKDKMTDRSSTEKLDRRTGAVASDQRYLNYT